MNILKNLFKGDKVIWMVYFFLCLISLIEVYSATSTMSFKTGNYLQPFLQHLGYLAFGACIVIITQNISYSFFRTAGILLWPFSILLLIWVLFRGKEVNDAARWISIFGIRFQPSEFAKGTLIMATAFILSITQTEKGSSIKAFKWIFGMTSITCAFIVTENASTAALLACVIFMMMFIGRIPIKILGALVAVAIVGITALFCLLTMPSMENIRKISDVTHMHRLDTWAERIRDHKDLPQDAKEYNINENLQRSHGNIAIATSNIIGKMPGNSEERDFLPQAYSDFIYAIIIEELGLIGGVFVLFLYIVLLFRAGRIANRCERIFPALLIMGLALLISTQAMLNMMVATGLFPVTGQPLPLISRGGTSIAINCVYIGIMLSISRYAKKKTDLMELEEESIPVLNENEVLYSEENVK